MADKGDLTGNDGGKDAQGRWVAGNNANPTGKTGKSPWQPYAVRMQHWLDNYSTQQIIDLVENEVEFGKLMSRDGMIVRHLANSFKGADIHRERESLLNRVEGKPTENVKVMGGTNTLEVKDLSSDQMGKCLLPTDQALANVINGLQRRV